MPGDQSSLRRVLYTSRIDAVISITPLIVYGILPVEPVEGRTVCGVLMIVK